MGVLGGNKADHNNGQFVQEHAGIINHYKFVPLNMKLRVIVSCTVIAAHPILSSPIRLEILVINLEVMFATVFLLVIESRMSVNGSSC